MVGSVILGGGLFLAGCSAGSSSSSASSGNSASSGYSASSGTPARAASVPAEEAPAPLGPAAAGSASGSEAGQPQNGTGTTVRLAPASDIIYTAQLTVRAGNVSSAVAKAAQIAEGVGGYISNETASANPGHPSEATASVQLKIPVTAYQATLGQLESGLGTQLSLQQQAQDVTEQVADVNSQVASDQAAIVQLRALLSHAGSVSDLLTVQNQINAEESSLESMQAQQRALDHEVSYATLTLTILGPKAKALVHRPTAPPSLASGFGAGWRALRIALSWTLALLGALAPFVAILALAGYVVYLGRRRILRRRPAARPASPEN
ncbi:MAG TPA: DUF4349 domain-containing protein [Streptosporangiaceae bacterium]|jgi:hypothetical protein|nr:DUF4349 domain-containing protein [Streptosporangiaceae bacterium]